MNQTRSGQTKAAEKNSATLLLSLIAVTTFFIAAGLVNYFNIQSINAEMKLVAHTHEVITGLGDVLSLVKDAETSQRGYLLTGEERYLEPYNQSIPRLEKQFAYVENLIGDNPEQQSLYIQVRDTAREKLAELNETIELVRSGDTQEAQAVVLSDRGKETMDRLRGLIGTMRDNERALREARISAAGRAFTTAVVSAFLSAAIGIILSAIIALMMKRAANRQNYQDWLQKGQMGLSGVMVGDQRIEQLGDNILKFLADYLNAQAGVMYVQVGGSFNRVATYGVPASAQIPPTVTDKDGILGRVIKDGRSVIVSDIPPEYLSFGSALGSAVPRQIAISPGSFEGRVNAVFEIGFVKDLPAGSSELLNRVSELIGIAIRSAKYRSDLQNYLEETQRQSEELQAQSEELRVNNEELEEQARALKESQARLEQQQVELEQTNSQLEEQAQQLERQRDEIDKSRAAIQLKAQELEQASQYKSDFLANMSHELRTPLNSSLILAKLLADNSQGNLSEEQVKFAKTIQSSGNDLLALINDILDLSKIEAGHMDIRPEQVPLDWLAGDMTRLFEPIGAQKNIAFQTNISGELPKSIETDRLRLEQILKNLLSNAFKFTEKGSVTLSVSKQRDGLIAFAVQDTGIGISKEQQANVFEAFRQADGTISRRYGGTGLGLSISRELARLLGGYIRLESEQGKGSIFTLCIPAAYDPANIPQRAESRMAQDVAAPAPALTVQPETVPARQQRVQDDRDKLQAERRLILVVEDDEPFARILYDLAHEMSFQCLLAHTAEEAIALIRRYQPNAVLLDVGLPDNSGLSVLDRLKSDVKTRHIPVHVISADDYAETALSLGAVGYLLKPVKHDELSSAFRQLEGQLSQQVRRVLVVEDDETQRESVMHLLGTLDVQTVGAATAAECLELLKTSTFDCMVLDLALPDSSGYNLLETLSREDAYSFPPVIVYTGRDLSAEDEQNLRRYSKSIIIKGAKSPERLLDEVTLFLHQVVSKLPQQQQDMLKKARARDAVLEGRRILVVEDDIRNVYAVTNIFEPLGAHVQIARNGKEALQALADSTASSDKKIDLVLMDVMMPEMDGLTATRELRKEQRWKKLPVIMLTAKAMRDDQERCIAAGANDYMAKPLDVEKLLSLVRVWMPR